MYSQFLSIKSLLKLFMIISCNSIVSTFFSAKAVMVMLLSLSKCIELSLKWMTLWQCEDIACSKLVIILEECCSVVLRRDVVFGQLLLKVITGQHFIKKIFSLLMTLICQDQQLPDLAWTFGPDWHLDGSARKSLCRRSGQLCMALSRLRFYR